MEYVITRSVLSFTQTIPLTREEYGRLREVKAGLVVALGIEEKFNIVRDNYAELEMELLRLGVEQMVFQEEDWGELVSEIYTINRRLLNLLSAARLYRDQIVRDISDVWGPGSSAVEQVREAREREEQESLPFRFMEALRNSIQHHSLPVYQLSRPMERDECKDGSIRIRHRADARIKWSHLAADKNFSAALPRTGATRRKGSDSAGSIRSRLRAITRPNSEGRSRRDLPKGGGMGCANAACGRTGWSGVPEHDRSRRRLPLQRRGRRTEMRGASRARGFVLGSD
jgi:hypothetical protein